MCRFPMGRRADVAGILHSSPGGKLLLPRSGIRRTDEVSPCSEAGLVVLQLDAVIFPSLSAVSAPYPLPVSVACRQCLNCLIVAVACQHTGAHGGLGLVPAKKDPRAVGGGGGIKFRIAWTGRVP